jgi:hypothetical protein
MGLVFPCSMLALELSKILLFLSFCFYFLLSFFKAFFSKLFDRSLAAGLLD